MSDSLPSVSVRELLEHSTWVHDLARRLARDPGSAEDLAQDTWVAALEHPPLAGRPVRGWLGTVVRNFALQSRRGESRRSEREERAAAPESVPSTDEVLERASVQQQVASAVMKLDEPYRTAILLRFFEDLPPRAIARRLGVPVETVRTRIGRGIDRLRAVLDREHGGDRRAWLCALLPLADRPWGFAPSALGAVTMQAKLFLSVAAVSALAVGAWLVYDGGVAPAEAVASSRTVEPIAPPVAEPVHVAPAAAARTEIVAAEPEPAAQAAPVPEAVVATVRPLRGLVLDANGAGIAGVEIDVDAADYEAVDEDGEPVRVVSAGGGHFAVANPPASARLRAVEGRHTTVLASYYRRDQAADPVLVVAPRLSLGGVVVDETGAPLEDARVEVVLPDGFRGRFDVVLDSAERVEWTARTDGDGLFELPSVPLVEDARVRVAREGFVPHEAALPAGSDTALRITLARPTSTDGIVRGRVVDAAGVPISGAYVACGVDTMVTDADGSFVFATDEPQSFSKRYGYPFDSLVAVKPGLLPARWEPPMEAGEPQWPANVTLVLKGEAFTLAGRVVHPDGTPLPGARVWVSDTTFFGALEGRPTQLENVVAQSEDPFWYFVSADDNGRFEIRGLLDRDYSVRAMDTETMLFADFGPFAAGTLDVELALPTDRIHPLVAGRIVSHDGDPIPGAAVFPMCDVHSARARGSIIGTRHMTVPGTTTDSEGRFELHNVPASLVYLRIEGETILPLEYGRLYNESDPRFVDAQRGLPEDEIERLEIQVEQRCHLQVELSDPAAADEVGMLDGRGVPLTINIMTATGRRDGPRLPIQGGRSATLAVPDVGRTLVLYLGGEEIGRMPVELVPGEVVTVTF